MRRRAAGWGTALVVAPTMSSGTAALSPQPRPRLLCGWSVLYSLAHADECCNHARRPTLLWGKRPSRSPLLRCCAAVRPVGRDEADGRRESPQPALSSAQLLPRCAARRPAHVLHRANAAGRGNSPVSWLGRRVPHQSLRLHAGPACAARSHDHGGFHRDSPRRVLKTSVSVVPTFVHLSLLSPHFF